MPAPSHDLAAGQLRRQIKLETEAIYRVCTWSADLVEVEVVSAPGLAAGRRFRFKRELVELMDVVADSRAVEPPGSVEARRKIDRPAG